MIKSSDIVISLHSVVVCGQQIKRPSYVSPMQWEDFWEAAKRKLDDKR